MNRIFNKNAALIRFVRCAVGYALTGSTQEQVIFVFWGSGANGKSTFLETFLTGLGDYAQPADSSLLLTRDRDTVRNDVARLAGVRFVPTGETEAGKHLAEALIKKLTGGDTVTARYLYSEFFDFRNQAKLFLATNHKPIIRGSDRSIWRRIRLVPFLETIPEAEQDKALPQKLRKELPGILAWAVEGCLQWQREGLGLPDEVLAATQAYREDMGVMGQFLKDCVVQRTDLQDSARRLYSVYKQWCETNGERPLSQQRFGIALADRGFRPRRTRRTRLWIGLKCSDGDDVGDTVLQ